MLHNGKKYARVTEVLRRYSDFSHIDPKVLKNKCDIGTRVHEAINEDINGEFACVGGDEKGYFDSYLEWQHRVNPVFLKSEVRYFDNMKMLTGCIDALVLLGESPVPILVDFKTSAQESKTVWPMQAHLYDYLLMRNDIDVQTRYLFVKLDKWGKLPMVFEYKYDKNIMLKCLESIELYWEEIKSDSNKLPDCVE